MITYNVNERIFTGICNKFSSVIEANCSDRPPEIGTQGYSGRTQINLWMFFSNDHNSPNHYLVQSLFLIMFGGKSQCMRYEISQAHTLFFLIINIMSCL